MGKYLKFQGAGKSKSGRTLIVDVVAKKYEEFGEPALLGQIKWHNHWRDYCFYPCQGTLFNKTCMKEIATKLAKMFMDHHAKHEEEPR